MFILPFDPKDPHTKLSLHVGKHSMHSISVAIRMETPVQDDDVDVDADNLVQGFIILNNNSRVLNHCVSE
jgi:hypothetical protein